MSLDGRATPRARLIFGGYCAELVQSIRVATPDVRSLPLRRSRPAMPLFPGLFVEYEGHSPLTMASMGQFR